MTAADLARQAREQRTPTVEEGQARHAARFLRVWRDEPRGMVCGRFELPDVMGAKFEATIGKLVEQMRPAKGQPWARWEHRAADAMLVMCDAVDAAARIDTPMAAAPPLLVTEVGLHGPAMIANSSPPMVALPTFMTDFSGRRSFEISLYCFVTRIASETPGRFSKCVGSIAPGLPVTPIAWISPAAARARRPSSAVRSPARPSGPRVVGFVWSRPLSSL